MRGGVAVLAALCVLWAAEADELDDTLHVFSGSDRGTRTKSVTTSTHYSFQMSISHPARLEPPLTLRHARSPTTHRQLSKAVAAVSRDDTLEDVLQRIEDGDASTTVEECVVSSFCDFCLHS